MTTYVLRNGQLVEKHLATPLVSGNTAPNVISDIMEPTRHMASGRYHTSKAAFRQDTRDHNCIEVGTDQSILKPRKPIPLSGEQRRADIRRTIYELKNGRS
jgi:hypothetical protein